jgi:hypothetical protein
MPEIDSGKLPAIIFQNIGALKPESHIKPDEKIAEVKPEAHSG